MAGEQIRYVLDVDDKGTPKLVKFGEASSRAGRQAQTSMSAASDATSGLSSALSALPAVAIGAWAAASAKAVYGAAVEMESLERGLSAVMGSGALARDEMQCLFVVAKLPGLGYAEAIRMSTSLQAAGMSAEMARKAMASFGNALATVGKGKAELDGVGLALSQIMSKGKVSAEEINQIAERVPQIRKAMMDAFGTADTELLGKAGISSANFISTITDELGKLEKASGGAKNAAENFDDAWMKAKATIGGAFLPSVTAALNGVTSALEWQDGLLAKVVKKFIAYKMAGGAAGLVANALIDRDMSKIKELLDFSVKEEKKAADSSAKQEEEARQKRIAGLRKLVDVKAASVADMLKVQEQEYKRNVAAAKGNKEELEVVEAAHAAQVKRIMADTEKEREARRKKEVDEAKRSARAFAQASIEAQREADQIRDAETRARLERYANENRATADLSKRLTDNAIQIKRTEEEIAKAKEREKAALKALAEQRNADIISAFSPIQSVMQGFATDLLNGEASMSSFADSFKGMLVSMASEVAANAALFGILSMFGGGAAGTVSGQFLSGLSGLSSMFLGSFDVGTRALPATGPIIAHRGETILPATVSAAARSGDWGPAREFMGQTTNNSYGGDTITINVSGATSPRSIVREIETAKSRRKRGPR